MVPPSRHCLLLIGTLGVFVLERATKGQRYSTLIFILENTLRNCSCPVDVRACDYSLANLMCSCNTVLPAAVERSASYDGRLTIWFTDVSALGRLLNFTLVHDLKLALCSSSTLPSAYLAICGLRRLHVTTEAKSLFPEQSLFIHSGGDTGSEDKLLQSHIKGQPCTSVSFLDVALFNRNSSLKSYSIENVASIVHNFPSFSYFKTFPMASNQSCVVTVIY